jgi:hypothetical protein
MFCVYLNKFWSGAYVLPGGTFTTVPSNNFNKACCTPSPETSRVIDGLSLLRAILSISSIKTIPLSALQHHNQLLKQTCQDTLYVFPNITGLSVNTVASTIAKGTSSILAIVLATNVFTCSGLSHHDDVTFNLYLIVQLLLHQTFVVIVNRN